RHLAVEGQVAGAIHDAHAAAADLLKEFVPRGGRDLRALPCQRWSGPARAYGCFVHALALAWAGYALTRKPAAFLDGPVRGPRVGRAERPGSSVAPSPRRPPARPAAPTVAAHALTRGGPVRWGGPDRDGPGAPPHTRSRPGQEKCGGG